MPSEKYSLPLSSLRLANASTATDLFIIGARVVEGVVVLVRNRLKASRPAATTASAIVTATIFLPVRRLIDSLGSISDSSLIPSGVISNAQEKIRATGKPR